MKKKWNLCTKPSQCLTKLWKIMRAGVFLLIVLAAQIWAAESYSQATRLSLQMKDARLFDVLGEIEAQTEFYFLLNQKLVDVDRKVSIDVNQQKIEDILAQLFAGTNVNYLVMNRQIVLTTATPENLGLLKQPGTREITGTVTDSDGQPLIGVSIVVKGTTIGTITDINGNFLLEVTSDAKILVFSFVGMKTQEVSIEGLTIVNVELVQEITGIDEIVVVGYGVQRKSDITGSIESVGRERLDMVPNTNIAQVIQGAISGVTMQTTTAGAVPGQTIMVRGRNSILADNSPLIIVDGISYTGELKNLNPNDIQSIEILKDASAAAIYGSRGANGVILITTQMGNTDQKPRINYDGYYSMQSYTNLPDYMNGEEFYKYKREHTPNLEIDKIFTISELEMYESGEWTDWVDLSLRNGSTMEHNLSVSGGSQNTQYYISGGVTDITGLAVNDDYLRITSRINLNTSIRDWLTIGTRTQLLFDDQSGLSPSIGDGDQTIFSLNPLSRPYDEFGTLTLYPWPEDTFFENPLQGTLAHNLDESYEAITNNYAVINFPFIQGLSYRINLGFNFKVKNQETYWGRDTANGNKVNGEANTVRNNRNFSVIENVINYKREFGKHSLFFTGVYSYEHLLDKTSSVDMSEFPHDFLTFYSSSEALIKSPGYNYDENVLISQMLRLNYSYNNRYMLTLTGRRDGFSGFGAATKYGTFPSFALAWNAAREDFFPWGNIFNELKPRISYGLNGNQAVGAYETISRLSSSNFINGTSTLSGYIPAKLGMNKLGWESSKTLNAGIDFGILKNRITADINYFITNTRDLLLNRAISSVHGITSITQNIGETKNTGIEFSFNSSNIMADKFKWITRGNFSWMKNEIVSLYGVKDEAGKEYDDVANNWFIGYPIKVNFGYEWDGIWQLDEADIAATYNTYPGYIKVKDVNDDGVITPDDRKIMGQLDPKFLWGMNNTFSYGDLSLSVFIHGSHGVTKENILRLDTRTGADVRRNVTNKTYWTPETPDADHPLNLWGTLSQQGAGPLALEDASFVRIKDIVISYNLDQNLLDKLGMNQVRIYFTMRNLHTFTKWRGLDPELDGQKAFPLQREFVFGLNLGL